MMDTLSVLGPHKTVDEPVETRRDAPFRKKEKKVLEAYVRKVANLMGLKDWTIELEWDVDVDEDADADISVLYGRKFASMRLARTFRRQTPQNQRYTIVHELLHCHMAATDEFVRRSAEGLLGVGGSTAMMVGYEQHTETAVDGVASGISNLFDVPELNPTKKNAATKT